MKKTLSLLILGSLFLTSCEKLLEQEPQSSLDAATAFTTPQAVDAGILGIYNSLQGASYYGTAFTLFADLEADNLDHIGSFPTYQEVKNRQINPDNVDITNTWNAIYDGVNRANTLIDAIPKISDADFDKASRLAEAKFLRAFLYFDLIRFYGGSPTGYADPNGLGVPLVLTPTLSAADATAKPRATEAEVMTQILQDLDAGIADLPDQSDIGRVNKNAAIAMKARVSLYLEKFQDAETLSTQIINQFSSATSYGGLAEDYPSIFLAKNVAPESIWELQFSSTNSNGLYFYYFGRTEVRTSDDLADAHETGDLRLPVNYYDDGANIGSLKYSRASGIDDIMLIRLAEVYLIRAESRARKQTPNIADAQADLNVVRARAGLGNTMAATPAALLAAVLQERRVELAHEAHRWFDLRRTGLAASLFGIADARKVLWPIPQSEVLTSGNVIAQNPGY